MKEYDIYLKKRIHEAKLFIYSIPYRDGVSVTNRVILEAMLDYYTLQKAVAVQNNTELAAEIDEIINIVHERIGTRMEIQARADFLSRYYNELEREAIELNIPELLAFIKSFFSVEDTLQMRVADIDAIAKSSLGHVASGIAIQTEDVSFLETVYEVVRDGLELGAKIKRTHKQSFETIQSGLQITTPDLDLFYCYTTGLETAMSLAAEIVDMEIHYSLGRADTSFAIATSEPNTSAVKHLSISEKIGLFCDMAATVVSYFQAGGDLTVAVDGVAGLKRYRLLSEMDDLTLAELDDSTLEELDYVWLT